MSRNPSIRAFCSPPTRRKGIRMSKYGVISEEGGISSLKSPYTSYHLQREPLSEVKESTSNPSRFFPTKTAKIVLRCLPNISMMNTAMRDFYGLFSTFRLLFSFLSFFFVYEKKTPFLHRMTACFGSTAKIIF